jgi:hypothetical protein
MEKNKSVTAVEWLMENSHIIPKTGLNKRELINQAKEMEKEQIKDAFQDSRILCITNNCSSGEQYYNETFKSE